LKTYPIPVVLIVFNRVDLVEKQLNVLKKIVPEKLFIICDAPRAGNDTDMEAVTTIKSMIDSITWCSQILKNYATENMGCDRRITSGLDWVFQYVEEAIILEDDCIPSKDFFKYCEELLEKYKNIKNIFYISGSNEISRFKMKNSYLFIPAASTWGWATWKCAWDTFDYNTFLIQWDNEKNRKVKWEYSLPGDRKRWISNIDRNRKNGIIPWDYCWSWHVIQSNGLSVVPQKNMIENVGFRTDATHTMDKPEKYEGVIEKMNFPLMHPDIIEIDKGYYLENWKYEKPNYLKKLIDINFYKRQWKKIICKGK